jgi:hypothetical protein
VPIPIIIYLFHLFRESALPIGLRADGIILLADEDCSKDLILDTYGCDPTLVTSLAASSNILFDNVFAATTLRGVLHIITVHIMVAVRARIN